MSKRTSDARLRMSSSAQNAGFFIWPLSESAATPDEMNTSFGARIDADRWDFHDGIDLPAALGTPVHAMADGTVHRAGPADEVFGSTHVRLKVVDPTDGQDNLFLIYLHLDSIAEGIIPGAQVKQGDIIGAVGQEDATYPHLHFEFRKGGPEQVHSVHPLHYLPYLNKANFRKLRLDRCNFYREGGDKRMVRLRFDLADRREGDLLGVDVEVTGEGVDPRKLRVDFDDRNTIVSDKGDQHAFNEQGIAVEGYQKSNLKGEGRNDLHYGVLVKDITPEFKSVRLQVLDVENGKPKSAKFSLPTLGIDEKPINSSAGFEESQAFPPPGWELSVLPGNVCRPDPVAALIDSRGLLCRDLQSVQGRLIRAGLRFALLANRSPVRPMSWGLRADIRAAELQMERGRVIYPLAFLAGDDVVAAACLRNVSSNELIAGVLIRSADGLFRERIDLSEGKIFRNCQVRCELEVLRLGTRQTTAALRLDNKVVARISGDTTSVEPNACCVGILHRHSRLQIALHVDQLLLTEAPQY